MPSGNKKVKWAPSEEAQMVKKASTETGEEVSEEVVEASDDDALYQAAKEHLETEDEEGLQTEAGEGCMGMEEVVEESGSESEGMAKVREGMEALEEELNAGPDAEVIEKLKDAKESISEVVEEMEGDDADVDIDVVDEVGEETIIIDLDEGGDDEGGDDEAGDDESDELIVESEPMEDKEECCDCNCDPCECPSEDSEGMEAVASDDSFVKLAHISPKNRSKLVEFWSQIYPKDYVDLIVKDSEK
jgi:hypothetical protein